MPEPLISVVVPTKNSMPRLKTSIEALRTQTYRKFEVVIQDGGSTDGTLEYLESIRDLPKLSIVSEKDSGIGQAYARGIKRCNGDFICLSASDECLFHNSLAMGIDWFKEFPGSASIYGGMSLVDEDGAVKTIFCPPPYNLIRFMRCELFPTTAGLLNRNVIGADLYYDESVKTCPDYDFWMRLGLRFGPDKLIARQELFMAARADNTSASFRPEVFEQFCKDKCFILDRFINSQEPSSFLESIRPSFKAAIYLWGAQMALDQAGPSEHSLQLCKESAKIDPYSPILLHILESFSNEQIEKIRQEVKALPPKAVPPDDATIVKDIVDIDKLRVWPAWGSTIIKIPVVKIFDLEIQGPLANLFLIFGKFMTTLVKSLASKPLLKVLRQSKPDISFFIKYLVKGGSDPSCYSALLDIKPTDLPLTEYNYWWTIRFNVKHGQIGFLSRSEYAPPLGTYSGKTGKGEVVHYIPINVNAFQDLSLVVRNAGQADSEVMIYDINIVSAPKKTDTKVIDSNDRLLVHV